jgi:uncharacterized protein YecE (DUF72 family)
MIHIGTSGFSYRDWIGPFYPEGLRKEEYLPFYARFFDFTEINYTYYRMPSPSSLEKMCEKVPEDFLFTIKAHGSLTHERDKSWKKQCREFCHALVPLEERKMLGGVLLQFPFSFHYTPENRRYLDALLQYLRELHIREIRHNSGDEGIPLFVEFRGAEWQSEQVFDGLRERETGVVVTDQPELKGLPAFTPRICGIDAYFRFHGRNKENWWTGDNTSRYDYLYSREELSPLSKAVGEAGSRSRRLFAAFNNHRKGQAIQNARDLQMMLIPLKGI